MINFFHPIHTSTRGIYRALEHHVDWWITLHVLNLGAFALLGLAAYQLLRAQVGIAATIGRIALAMFVPLYVGFDTLIGIAAGLLIRYAKALPADQLPVLEPAIDLFWSARIPTALAAAGSMTWTVGMVMAAISFSQPRRLWITAAIGVVAAAATGWGASTFHYGTHLWWAIVAAIGAAALIGAWPRVPVAMLMLAGIFFGTTHVVPYGPLGMACFLIAVTLLEIERRRTGRTSAPAVSIA